MARSAKGRALFVEFIQGFLTSGNADGMFADKWGGGCKEVNAT